MNARPPSLVTDEGIITELKFEYSKAKSLIQSILLPAEKVSDLSRGVEFNEKARVPIVVTFAGIFRV